MNDAFKVGKNRIDDEVEKMNELLLSQKQKKQLQEGANKQS